jgi:cysteine desulfurase
MLQLFKKKRIYLDYAAATPVAKEVFDAMRPYFCMQFANASAIHKEGVQVRTAIETARTTLASVLKIRPQGVVFTGSGTESNNLALLGYINKKHQEGVAYTDMEVVSTKLEHSSVIEVLAHLKTLGVRVVYAAVTNEGRINLQQFGACLSRHTVLVTCTYVNSEIGVIEDVGKISRAVRAYAKEQGTHIHIHIDAAQAALWLPCALDQIGADSLSLDAGKCYGPKGVGVLAFAQGKPFAPHLFGGSQEGGLRPGTENTPLIIGCVAALVRAQKLHVARSQKVQTLRDHFITLLLEIPGCELNGSRENRVANNIDVSLEGIDAEFAVISLDEKEIACATKSACGGARGDGSAVVLAISNDAARALSTIRFTLGEETTLQELQYTARVLKNHVTKTRAVQKHLTKV